MRYKHPFVKVNKAIGKTVNYNTAYNKQYPASGAGSLTDGQMGTTAFKDGKWIGYNGSDLDVVLDMQSPLPAKAITCNFLADPNSGIFLPSQMNVYTSLDGITYNLAGTVKNTNGSVRGEPYLQPFTISVATPLRYIRILAKTIGAIPDGYLFKGSTSWLFADEILVQ